MTFVHNAPDDFAREAVEGLAAAYPEHLVAVTGGAVRATSSPDGEVCVVLGGGSGHYPAFAGWVGRGFAHAAACGNTFASPPATHIANVARTAQQGGGVVLGFGNYAGDVLHFGQAAEILRAEGHDVRIVAVADDVASAPTDQASTRRGVAGDLVVFKCLAAAAAEGMGLDDVERVGRLADSRTRSFGVAFTGCTLPGAGEPLFTVATGRLGLGLGIHGEPGLGEGDLVTADELADLLLDRILVDFGPDRPGDRVAVLVNGLGSTTHEELFVLYRRLAAHLAEKGLTPVGPEVGELVTSLDMAGVSLTLTVLDDELERLWLAPADTPAFRRGSPAQAPRREVREDSGAAVASGHGSPESRYAAQQLVVALAAVRDAIGREAGRLGDIDAVAGDGDHGIGMSRGTAAAADRATGAVESGTGLGGALSAAGLGWSEAAGGTSGALWGGALAAAAASLGDERAPGPQELVAAVEAAVAALARLGGARVGDKTMLDAARPFADTLADRVAAGDTAAEALAAAVAAAGRAADATADLVARLGRAKTHGDHSLGTPDAGAVSFALVAATAARAWPTTTNTVTPQAVAQESTS
ncbi:dihydroxyacetone kinase family protein [Knoellia koreensis]|uniref:Dihydroxyacetone kinase family protein n=1 Tax=Knoellia koreensis TaxID=2730921 RepID=A0A849HJB0_9MICO|nr:dihydroxyacetone kinase family protein [Knoellia sp. DB2414S]NNM47518.1 dihydroxyacetone kinase family protein [Knoellia sp. DB2414S]